MKFNNLEAIDLGEAGNLIQAYWDPSSMEPTPNGPNMNYSIDRPPNSPPGFISEFPEDEV